MYIVREIFYLQFGRYKDAKVLIDEATQGGLFPQTDNRKSGFNRLYRRKLPTDF